MTKINSIILSARINIGSKWLNTHGTFISLPIGTVQTPDQSC